MTCMPHCFIDHHTYIHQFFSKNLLNLNPHCTTTALSWSHNKDHHYNSSNYNNNKSKTKIYRNKNISKTLIITKPPNLKPNSFTSFPPQNDAPLPKLQLQHHYDQTHSVPHLNRSRNSLRHKEIVENFEENEKLRFFIEKLNRNGANPVQMLEVDGDWSDDRFWIVVRFLKHESRFHEILQVFNVWKIKEKSRVNELNYRKIIGLLSEEGLTEDSISALQEMKSCGLAPSLDLYNVIIQGFARKSKFEEVLFFFKEMDELNLLPNTKTYNVLIEAYGHFKIYDEIGICVKKMETSGVLLDHFTYNLLIKEFARSGLFKRMESVYRSLRSRQMELQPSTLIAMLEAYTNFRLVEKVEQICKQILNSRGQLGDELVRKMACVYLEGFIFSRLDDLGLGLSSKTTSTGLVWCLRLLSHACIMSRTGMDSTVCKMEEGKVAWTINFSNIILLANLKMRAFKHLESSFMELKIRRLRPDIVTLGILFDAMNVGFDGIEHLNTWRRTGFLARTVEMNTDQLVFTAFGKGHFLQSFEEKFSSLEPKARENEAWDYQKAIDFIFQ